MIFFHAAALESAGMLSLYTKLATTVLVVHLLFILWLIFGALVAYRRPRLRWLHIVSLVWGVLVELTPWPCPLTLLEIWLEGRAGIQPYQGAFLLHYLDATVYPNVSPMLLVVVGLIVCLANLGIYAFAFITERQRRKRTHPFSGSTTNR
jgi:Protein of Unknown function (DUF2784)